MKYFILTLVLLTVGCKKDRTMDYGDYLSIEMPSNLELAYRESSTHFQDYTNVSIYFLSSSQYNFLKRQIEVKICESSENNGLCWQNSEITYYLCNSDSVKGSGYYLNVVLTEVDLFRTLMIEEVQL